DRRSEHVACAGGEPVLSAGEVTFSISSDVRVVNVTNQSTGYCPQPASWPAVASALAKAGLDAPAGFDPAYEFRRCICCNGLSIIKDAVFECPECGAALPLMYNAQVNMPG